MAAIATRAWLWVDQMRVQAGYLFWLSVLTLIMAIVAMAIRPELIPEMRPVVLMIVAFWFGKGVSDGGAGGSHRGAGW